MLLKSMKKDRLEVEIYDLRSDMGERAAQCFAACVAEMLQQKDTLNIIFAAAPSQNDFLQALEKQSIEWEKINVFHMDEYVGIGIESKQSFARFVKDNVVDRFPVRSFHAINGKAQEATEECERYSTLLREHPVDIVCLGIGENTHIAFNDPGEADFWDDKLVKVVTLDERCREQQVHDKCFPNLEAVPQYALTLTVPTLMRAEAMFCIVPGSTKSEAVRLVINEPVDFMRPASALRLHKRAFLFCDKDSGKDFC